MPGTETIVLEQFDFEDELYSELEKQFKSEKKEHGFHFFKTKTASGAPDPGDPNPGGTSCIYYSDDSSEDDKDHKRQRGHCIII